MAINELIEKIEALKEYEIIIAEAEREAEALKDIIKAAMTDAGTDEMIAGNHIVRWTPVTSNRFDSATFKKAHADLYAEFTKQSQSKRFSIT